MTPQTPAGASKVSQPPYTLAQVRANLKLIAGICALDLPNGNSDADDMAKGLDAAHDALCDIQARCGNILHRGIVGEEAVTKQRTGSLRITVVRFGRIWRWLVFNATGNTVAGGFAWTKKDANKCASIAFRVAGGAK